MALTDFELEKVAERSRCVSLVHERNQPNVLIILKRLRDLVPDARYEVLNDDCFASKEEGRTNCEEKLISLPRSVMENLKKGNPRARLTVMHEIGHLILGHEGVLSRAQNDPRARNSTRVMKFEREAWGFARAFLAPKRLIEKSMTVQQISAKFGISTGVAKIRLEQVQRMNRLENGERREIPDFVKEFLNDAKKQNPI